jgi:DNA-binding GntR family transcriptional regulator
MQFVNIQICNAEVASVGFRQMQGHISMNEKTAGKARPTAAHRIEAALMGDIATGLLKPGERLDEVALTARFDVSRTPVREALTRLAAQGVLVASGKRGLRVVEYSREELAQIFEAMHEIEVTCARMAAQRLSLLSRSEIERAQADCLTAAENGDIHGYMRANERFHSAIYQATGNPHIAEIAAEFRRKTGPFRAKKFASKADLIASAKSHEDLIKGLFSEDSKTASDGMRTHMTASFLRVLETG